MPKLETEVEIRRPVEVVFDYVSDPTNMPVWSGPVRDGRLDSATMQKGAQFTVAASLLGKRFDAECEVIEYERPTRYAFRAVGRSPFPLDGDTTLEPRGEGATLVRATSGVDAAGFFKLADRVLAPIARRQFNHDFQTLRDILEAEA